MKKLCTLLIIAVAFLVSCNDSDDKNKEVTTLKQDSIPKKDTLANPGTIDNEAKNFVMKAGSGGMMEVQLGQLAQQKAKNQRVKDFGKMMVDDHSKANDELKSLAASKSILIPSALLPDHQKHVDMLKDKTGSDFDKAYMKMMVDDHKEDIGEFKKESERTNDDPFKSFAGKTLPVLQKHLDSAIAINNKL